MRVSNKLNAGPARMRVLGQGCTDSGVLRQHTCLRCGNTWWPRRPSKPLRCPGCKSPYWDRPRKLIKKAPSSVVASVSPEKLHSSLSREMARAFGTGQPEAEGMADRSLAKALEVLKEMKASGRTWHEMAERVEREFGTPLDKEQLKALVR